MNETTTDPAGMTIKQRLMQRRIVQREIPGYGAVRVRSLIMNEVHEVMEVQDGFLGTKWLIVFGVVDEQGAQVFAKPEAIDETLDLPTIKALAEAVADVSGLKHLAEHINTAQEMQAMTGTATAATPATPATDAPPAASPA